MRRPCVVTVEEKGNTNGYFSRFRSQTRFTFPCSKRRLPTCFYFSSLSVSDTPHRIWWFLGCFFFFFPPVFVSDKWKKSLLVSMRINPKARSDILNYKLTAYKCQAGSHGRDGATSPRCAVNIPHQMIERLSGDNELNLFTQLLYIDGLLPQVIKVTFQLQHPPTPVRYRGDISTNFPKRMTEITFSPEVLWISHVTNTKLSLFIQKGGEKYINLTKHYPDW